MSISTRRKFGGWLLAISAVAMIVFVAVGSFRGDWHDSGVESSGGIWSEAGTVHLKVSEYYFIPIVLCGAVGVLCWLWPARKPPKLNQ